MFFSLYFWVFNLTTFFVLLLPFFILVLLKPIFKNLPFAFAVFWSRMVMRSLFIPITVKKPEAPAELKGTVIICNHQSMLDIPLLLGYLPYKFHFILKDSLMRIPVFGWVLKALNFYPINRSDPRQAKKTLDYIVERIDQGENVLIFPEGTRSRNGQLSPFKKGALRLAEASAANVLPVAISGTFDLSVKGSRKIKRAPVSLNIGKLILNPGKNIKSRQFNIHLEAKVKELLENV